MEAETSVPITPDVAAMGAELASSLLSIVWLSGRMSIQTRTLHRVIPFLPKCAQLSYFKQAVMDSSTSSRRMDTASPQVKDLPSAQETRISCCFPCCCCGLKVSYPFPQSARRVASQTAAPDLVTATMDGSVL